MMVKGHKAKVNVRKIARNSTVTSTLNLMEKENE